MKYHGRIIQHINHKKGLQNNTVLTSFVDKKNNLWLGLDNGIAFINENSPFSYFGYSYDLVLFMRLSFTKEISMSPQIKEYFIILGTIHLKKVFLP